MSGVVEYVACPLCRTDKPEVVHEHAIDRLHGIPGIFRLVRCTACSLVYLNPRPAPAELERFYPEEYESFYRALPTELPPLKRWLVEYGMRRRCRVVTHYTSCGRLLDVGCGTGHFLAAMRRRACWSVEGIEPSRSAAEFARQTFNLVVHNDYAENLALEPHSYDVITMWDVIEHTRDPLGALATLRRWLKPSGYLIVRTPNLGSWDSRLFGKFWAGLDTPRHLVVFSKRTLRTALERAGFRLVAQHPGGGGHDILRLSLRFFLDSRPMPRHIKGALLAAVSSLPARVALLPSLAALDRAGLGAEVIFVARPQSKHD